MLTSVFFSCGNVKSDMIKIFLKNTHTGKEKQKIESNLPLPERQQVILVGVKSPDEKIETLLSR